MNRDSHTKEKGAQKLRLARPPGRLSLWVCSVTVGILPFWFLQAEGLGSLSMRVSLAAGSLVVALVAYYFFRRRAGPPRRAAIENRYRVCLKCYYPLHGLANVGKCPECGDRYDIDITARIWERRIAPWRSWFRKRPARSFFERLVVRLFVGIPAGVLLFVFVALIPSLVGAVVDNGGLVPESLEDRLLGAIAPVVYSAIVPTLAAGLTWLIIRRKIKAIAIQNDFLLCTHCRAPLKSPEEEGACPNCGKHFEAAQVRKLWRAEYYVYS